jgi:hypothetical protein
MSFSGINYIAVVIAAVAGFGVGAVWYSFLFQKLWMAEIGMTEADMNARASGGGPALAPLLAGNIVGNLVLAFVLSAVLHSLGAASIGAALGVAFVLWLGFVLTTFAVNNAFSGRSITLTAIDGGHWLVVMLLGSAIIGAFG